MTSESVVAGSSTTTPTRRVADIAQARSSDGFDFPPREKLLKFLEELAAGESEDLARLAFELETLRSDDEEFPLETIWSSIVERRRNEQT